MTKTSDSAALAQAPQAIVDLCAGVLPVWARHLAASRAQSEAAVAQMLRAFAEIGPHLNRAERQSLQFSEALSRPDGGAVGLVAACEQRLAPLMTNMAVPEQGREAIAQVLELVRNTVEELHKVSQPLVLETQMVTEQVDQMYSGFQYQDRISQMMALLENDMARLQQVLDRRLPDVPQIESWLAHLESHYAMAEQRHTHAGTQGAESAGDRETEFF